MHWYSPFSFFTQHLQPLQGPLSLLIFCTSVIRQHNICILPLCRNALSRLPFTKRAGIPCQFFPITFPHSIICFLEPNGEDRVNHPFYTALFMDGRKEHRNIIGKLFVGRSTGLTILSIGNICFGQPYGEIRTHIIGHDISFCTVLQIRHKPIVQFLHVLLVTA